MSTNAARRFLPSLSNSAVLCRAVRAGHVSMRQKMSATRAAAINAISVHTSGQDIRPEFADFDIERWALSVRRFPRERCNRARARARAREGEKDRLPPQKITAPHTR